MTKEREIFEKKYPAKKMVTNPFTACEAIGYLKHLKVSNPEQAEWIDKIISTLLTLITISMLALK